jgi:glycosyltransferase involved in cell wall biosynthesis
LRRILIVNCVFDPEPVVSAQIGKSIAEKLSSLQCHVTVIAPRPSRPFGFKFEHEAIRINDFELKYLDSYIHPQSGIIGRFRESTSFGIASYKYILANASQIDLVYMNTWPIFSQLAVALASKKIGKPYKIHIQDIYPESITNKLSGLVGYMAFKMLMPIEKYVLRNADKILVISYKMKQYLSKSRNLHESKFEVILNWQDDSVFHEYQNSWMSGLRTFMYLGNIGPVAGIPFVIEAFAKAALPDAQLIIAGVGSSKNECIKMAENYPEVNIQFIEVAEGKVPIIQSKAHVMILPLTKAAGNTSIPSKLPAYMFSARPVIALAEKGTDVEKTILESGGGWVGEPENEDWLINCFKQVTTMSDEKLIYKGNSAKQYAALYFAKENNLNKMINAILN